jgi:FixJ family two-component response regulator
MQTATPKDEAGFRGFAGGTAVASCPIRLYFGLGRDAAENTPFFCTSLRVRNRHGIGNRPFDRRGPWRTALGDAECAARCYFSVHPAATPRERIVTQSPPPPSTAGRRDEPTVFVVDDDRAVRDALASLFRSVGLRVAAFASAAELLQSKLPNVASCLVLDVRLPGVSGLDFQTELTKADIRIPIIFITGHGDIPMTVRAMKAGAIDFLTKPFRDQDMLDAVATAIERDRKRREDETAAADLRAHFEALTPREREVMGFVTAGMMNKQIAGEMGVSEITVKIHRGHTMRKMGAKSLVDLVRMAEVLGVRRTKP